LREERRIDVEAEIDTNRDTINHQKPVMTMFKRFEAGQGGAARDQNFETEKVSPSTLLS
jgi:hypothetical protein